MHTNGLIPVNICERNKLPVNLKQVVMSTTEFVNFILHDMKNLETAVPNIQFTI